jgi:hypothetical protein
MRYYPFQLTLQDPKARDPMLTVDRTTQVGLPPARVLWLHVPVVDCIEGHLQARRVASSLLFCS